MPEAFLLHFASKQRQDSRYAAVAEPDNFRPDMNDEEDISESWQDQNYPITPQITRHDEFLMLARIMLDNEE